MTKKTFPTAYPCPHCGRRNLYFANDPHRYGHQDTSRVYCTRCHSFFNSDELKTWIETEERNDNQKIS